MNFIWENSKELSSTGYTENDECNQPEGQGIKAVCFEGRKAGSGGKQYLKDFEQT